MTAKKMTFKQALENLKQAGEDINSAYYMEGIDKKYFATEEKEQRERDGLDKDGQEDPFPALWSLIKEAESIGGKIEEAIIFRDELMEAQEEKNA